MKENKTHNWANIEKKQKILKNKIETSIFKIKHFGNADIFTSMQMNLLIFLFWAVHSI